MAETTTQPITIGPSITVSDLADKLNLSAAKLVGELMKNGVMATINEAIDFDTAAIIAGDLGFELQLEEQTDERPSDQTSTEAKPTKAGIEPKTAIVRPPIIAVMGHVDHGKTSLLDAIRETAVAAGEAGGITQHIGAYQVTKNDRVLTFLDTPGHEAFSALRAHGAKMTDIAIIVVAADDGVKPQTREAIEHARAAQVAIVVAINKIDKADETAITRVKQELSDVGVLADDWGGDVPVVAVSAKTGDGITKLLDVVLLVADITPKEAVFDGAASGVIIESHLERGRGTVVTVLVQQGSLQPGDPLVVGRTYGKVRSLEDFRGKKIKSATPSMPAVVSGVREVPQFGDWFEVVESERAAKDWSLRQLRQGAIKSLTTTKGLTASDISRAVKEGDVKELHLLVKADVQGSLETLAESLSALGNDEVKTQIVGSGIGDISEGDVKTAAAAGAIILGFNVSLQASVNQLAKRQSVDFHLYHVIYELLDDVREWLSSLLAPEIIETEVGRLKILGVFKIKREEITTGGKVTSGELRPGLKFRILRSKDTIGQGKLVSLQKDKQETKRAGEGEQCGVFVTADAKIALNDELVFFTTEERARKI